MKNTIIQVLENDCIQLKARPQFYQGFPGSSVGKESACNAGDPGSIPGSGRSPGEGMLEKGIFKKGFLESGKETVALGAGGLLHR